MALGSGIPVVDALLPCARSARAADLERDIAQHRHPSVAGVQFLDFEQRNTHTRRPDSRQPLPGSFFDAFFFSVETLATVHADGVPGTGSKILVDYRDQGGALTGKLFPSGNLVDKIRMAQPAGRV